MNAEHILEAVGLLDDDLIREAEEYSRPRRNYGAWTGLAASLAVVLILGYALTQLRLGGGSLKASNTSSGGAGAPASSAQTSPAGAADLESPPSAEGAGSAGAELPAAPEPAPDEPSPPGDAANSGGEERDCPAIMADGVLYWSTGVPVSVQVDESAARSVVSYTNAVPGMDGQTNFSQDLSAKYVQTSQGLAVLMEEEWILFRPAPAEE